LSTAPRSITELAAFWTAKGGVNLGIVGNMRHCGGYHLGADRIFGTCACRPDGDCVKGMGVNDYSLRLPRDRAGLTNAAAALDLGRLDGSLKQLYRFSVWLVAQCKARAPETDQIREVIYSPDGETVRRWDNHLRRSFLGGNGTGQGDDSHRFHTHISFHRDTEKRSKVAIFAPYFSDVPPPPEPPDTGADIVQSFRVPEARTFVSLPKGAKLYDNSALAANAETVVLDPGREFVLVGWFSDAIGIVAYEPAGGDPGTRSVGMFAKRSQFTDTRVEVPRTAADVKAARVNGYNEGRGDVIAAGQGVPKK
jgi:hypothetical protein